MVKEGSVGDSLAGRCETCAHWKFDRPDWEFDGLKFGECKGIKQRESIFDAIQYGEDEDRWDGGPGEEKARDALRAAKAVAVDGSGYYAALRTAPDFGCVLHEAATAAGDFTATGVRIPEQWKLKDGRCPQRDVVCASPLDCGAMGCQRPGPEHKG